MATHRTKMIRSNTPNAMMPSMDGDRHTPNASFHDTSTTEFPLPAQFIEADGGKGADQGEAGGQRKQQGQQVVAHRQSGPHQADDRIDDAEKHHMGRERREVVGALGQRAHEIAHSDLADHRKGRACVRAGNLAG